MLTIGNQDIYVGSLISCNRKVTGKPVMGGSLRVRSPPCITIIWRESARLCLSRSVLL